MAAVPLSSAAETVDHAEFFKTLTEKTADGGALRGDYSKADAMYVVEQDCAQYTPEQHDRWRRLYARQAELVPGRACDEFIEALKTMDAADGIPSFEATNEKLMKATGWRIVAVPGLIPDLTFFQHLAARQFPVTVWLREESEFNYIVEPDVFHDFFGHVPLLFNPIFADHMQEYGKGGLKAMGLDALTYLTRLYWYTVEFGLIRTDKGLRIFGAGILSSGGEVEYCLSNPRPRRVRMVPERVMQTLYKIDSYQETYFVIDCFKQLFDDTAPDFTPMYQRLASKEALPANSLLAGETDIAV